MESKLPTYEESVSGSSGSGHNLTQQATIARSQHIETLITDRIMPLLSDRASRGLSKTNLALLSTGAGVDWSELDIDSNEQYEPLRLKSDIDTAEFWSQPSVTSSLTEQLTNRVFQSDLLTDSEPLPTRPDTQRKLSRKTKLARALYMTYDDAPSTKVIEKENTRVMVEREEFWQRVQTSLGLWDTIAKEVIVVKVDLG